MKCPRCSTDAKEGWKFCPRCGHVLKRRSLFGNVFERMNSEIKEMDRDFERNFEVMDISPFFRKPVRGGGFSVKISSGGNDKPRIFMRTFGDVKREDIEQRIGKMGIGEMKIKPRPDSQREIRLESAETTEEPETTVKRKNGSIIAEIRLPGIKDVKNIEIKSLENSIEVKAMVGKKAYFKILTKPEKANIVRKEFGNGILRIELA